MLEHIDSEGSVFRSNHASNYLTLKGTLNRDREAMCEQIRTALERGGYKKNISAPCDEIRRNRSSLISAVATDGNQGFFVSCLCL